MSSLEINSRQLQACIYLIQLLKDSSYTNQPQRLKDIFELSHYTDDDYKSAISFLQLIDAISVTEDSVELIRDDSITILAREILLCSIKNNREMQDILLVIGPERDSLHYPNKYQLLIEARLLDWNDFSVQEWWRCLRRINRKIPVNDEKLDQIGFDGERLSWEFEKQRLPNYSEEIEWTANKYGDKAGFDIKSIISNDNSSPQYIEVKSSIQDLDSASIFLTFNEYSCMMRFPKNYIFHLWYSLNSKPNEVPIIIESEAVKKIFTNFENLPIEWTGAIKIPFNILVEYQNH